MGNDAPQSRRGVAGRDASALNIRPSTRTTPASTTKTSQPRITKHAASSSKKMRRPGRPFKMPKQDLPSPRASQEMLAASDIDVSQTSVTPEVAPPHAAPTPRSLSLLEALPVEVIEKIFLYSLNLNLPRASSVLAAALSRDRVYSLLTILAFWDDSSTHPRSEAMDRILAPLDYTPLTLNERGQLQQAVFRCRWCTMERIRDQVPTIMILTIHRQWLNMGVEMDEETQRNLDRFVNRHDDTVTSFRGRKHPLEAPALTSHPEMFSGPHNYRLVVHPMTMIEIRSETLQTAKYWPALSILRFPNHILRGRLTGFTADDVMFLEMLRMCSYNFVPRAWQDVPATITTLNRTVLHQGVRKAILTQNYNALVSLLKLDEFVFRCHESRRDKLVQYTIPPDHFVAATRVGRDNPQLNVAFFEALVRASAESVPADSSEILRWIMENTRLARRDPSAYHEVNGRFAGWLADFVLRLPGLMEHTAAVPEAQLFLFGQLEGRPVEVCRFIEEVLAPSREPFLNWTPESQFSVDGWWVKMDQQTIS
ncbi:hypothetical protein N7539_004880 [Penicillium diatomitis]|uniref:Uncharacterized protein n=1 Tax=Penicillium diatomitis TaxID=2819901 RepID=A0A9X0BUH0_9EURO|nr:uncharacterized protein N7539_004880 [Penicillium diatomitis]KAJ5484892.1 hypothetical protein N7539_004880 [Penicillium diatomitis]